MGNKLEITPEAKNLIEIFAERNKRPCVYRTYGDDFGQQYYTEEPLGTDKQAIVNAITQAMTSKEFLKSMGLVSIKNFKL